MWLSAFLFDGRFEQAPSNSHSVWRSLNPSCSSSKPSCVFLQLPHVCFGACVKPQSVCAAFSAAFMRLLLLPCDRRDMPRSPANCEEKCKKSRNKEHSGKVVSCADRRSFGIEFTFTLFTPDTSLFWLACSCLHVLCTAFGILPPTCFFLTLLCITDSQNTNSHQPPALSEENFS